ncbi:MAG: hypothetical protein AMJ43_03305 [Coxiella sp. DG_40]|nr:MAG: hypothetical protein AMJ43_03305 [Coxiella sp. DG_40]
MFFNSASAYTPLGQEKIKQFTKILIENSTLDEIITAFIFVANKILSSSKENSVQAIQELNNEIRSAQASLAAFLFKYIAYKYENNADVCKNFIKDKLSESAHQVIEDCWKGYIDDTKVKLKATQITFDNIKEDSLKNKLQLNDDIDLKPLPLGQSITSPEVTITTQLQNLIDSFCAYLNQDDQSHWHFEMKDTDYFFYSDSANIKVHKIFSSALNSILNEIKNAIKANFLKRQENDPICEFLVGIHKKLVSKDSNYKENSITRDEQLEHYIACIESLLNPELSNNFFSSETQQTLIKKINQIKEIIESLDNQIPTSENEDSKTTDNKDYDTDTAQQDPPDPFIYFRC